jgi:hypothetical protein
VPKSKKSKAKIADPGPTLVSGKNGALYLDSTLTFNDVQYFGESFDPSNVNWDDLLTLYQDDPLLTAVFEAMKEWSKSEDYEPNYKYQWTLNRPGTVLSTTSNVGVSNSFTLSYDSSGTATLTENKR